MTSPATDLLTVVLCQLPQAKLEELSAQMGTHEQAFEQLEPHAGTWKPGRRRKVEDDEVPFDEQGRPRLTGRAVREVETAADVASELADRGLDDRMIARAEPALLLGVYDLVSDLEQQLAEMDRRCGTTERFAERGLPRLHAAALRAGLGPDDCPYASFPVKGPAPGERFAEGAVRRDPQPLPASDDSVRHDLVQALGEHGLATGQIDALPLATLAEVARALAFKEVQETPPDARLDDLLSALVWERLTASNNLAGLSLDEFRRRLWHDGSPEKQKQLVRAAFPR